MERIKRLTTSQVKCFKGCRRRYFLEYEKGLKPISTPAPLELGTAYHRGVELLLKGVPLNAIREDLLSRAGDLDNTSAYVAFEMVKAFDRSVDYRHWKICSVEKQFEVTTGYAKRLIGKFDGIIEFDGKYLLEHKTTSQWGTDGSKYCDALLFDEQATNYIYAYSKLADPDCEGELKGIFYLVIEKCPLKQLTATPMDKRKYTKDGKLYAGQRDTDESLEEYLTRVEGWYLSENRIHQVFIHRTQEELDNQIADFNMVINDLTSCEREGTYYRNPEVCKLLACPYRPKCFEDNPETDCLFVKKERINEELNDETKRND